MVSEMGSGHRAGGARRSLSNPNPKPQPIPNTKPKTKPNPKPDSNPDPRFRVYG